jgi:hypothetical protein
MLKDAKNTATADTPYPETTRIQAQAKLYALRPTAEANVLARYQLNERDP